MSTSSEVAALKLAIGRVSRRLRQGHATGELTMSELSVLARIRTEPASPSTLAADERVRPQAMASTLAALEQQGLVVRAPDPADGRRVLIEPTEAGSAVLTDLHSMNIRRLTQAIEDEFSLPERDALLAVAPLLDRLAERL